MPYELEDIKGLGKGRDFRIFVAGNYRESAALGLLDKIAHWVGSFRNGAFCPIMMKDFRVPSLGKEPDWFRSFLKDTLPRFISKEERAVFTEEERNEVASTIYLIENCGYIFSELTTFGGGGAIPESLVAYRKGLQRHVFIQQEHWINPMLRGFVTGSNIHYYTDENNLNQLINTILQTLLSERRKQ